MIAMRPRTIPLAKAITRPSGESSVDNGEEVVRAGMKG